MVRFKNRYALCEVIVPGQENGSINFTKSKLYRAIKQSIISNHGDYGIGALDQSLRVIYINTGTRIVLIRAERKYFHMVTSAIIFIRKIGLHDVIFKTLHVGGSIRQCFKFLIKYHQKSFPSMYQSCQTEDDKIKVLESIIDACDASTSVKALMDKIS
ncbi:ribonuclease P/MRP protein subunit POP5-like [Biomphalaria glabrata]|uniref:Ribonuclease P/MRP protein subunit POP5 n=1 Tax=Biomphalaria glabrata TaxID=6526 RepID=A0A9W2YKM9_BIOGL|nr:ribonuclease P/MRP protein subunit POP5-like [Biomphalaria glabrata]